MTSFEDGPAKGRTLCLKRSPKYLRVVQDMRTMNFDALDQGTDTPEKAETIYAYVLFEHLGNCHINRGGKGSGFYPICKYKLFPSQPLDEIMRSNSMWQQWCEEQG